MQNQIELHPVVSSQIAAIGYDATTQTLAIQFMRKGLAAGIYNYGNVPQELYTRFDAAESKGKFFGEFIKGVKDADGNLLYPFTKMDD